jgi:hypothetical protein
MRAPVGAVGIGAFLALASAGAALAQPPAQPVPDPPPAEGTPPPPPSYTEPGPTQQPGGTGRVAIVLMAAGDVDSSIADALTELAIGAVAQRGSTSIVGKEEFQAQLGTGEQGTMECVSSTACLGRIGVQLNVDEVIAGTIGRRDRTWVFNLNRIDIRTGDLAGRVFREVEGDEGDLATAIQDAIPVLYEVVRRPATLLISASVEGASVTIDGIEVGRYLGEPVRQSDIPPGPHEVAISAPGYRGFHRTITVEEGTTLQVEADLESLGGGISPLVWVGLGIAVAASGAGVWFAIQSQERLELTTSTRRTQVIEYYDDRDFDALLANISFSVAGAGAVAALLFLIVGGGGDDEDDATAARPTVAPLAGGGTWLGVEGRW